MRLELMHRTSGGMAAGAAPRRVGRPPSAVATQRTRHPGLSPVAPQNFVSSTLTLDTSTTRRAPTLLWQRCTGVHRAFHEAGGRGCRRVCVPCSPSLPSTWAQPIPEGSVRPLDPVSGACASAVALLGSKVTVSNKEWTLSSTGYL